MQISHQHNTIICSQYGNHCCIDGFGDIPGQVVSALDHMIFWTLKSALILVSGMSLLIVEKFPSAGLHMVREANGQNKSRFTPSMMGTIFLVMTASHYYSACENILLRFQRPYFRMEEHLSAVALSISITVSVFLSAVLFDDYIYTLKLFRGGSGQQISLAFAAFGSRSTKIFSSINQISSVVKFYFVSRLIFPLIKILSSCFHRIQSNFLRNDHFKKLFEFKEQFLNLFFFLQFQTGT